MSLRMRLFLIFGGLVATLIAAQWWMLRAMTASLEEEVDEVAFTVGSSMASFFSPPGTTVNENTHLRGLIYEQSSTTSVSRTDRDEPHQRIGVIRSDSTDVSVEIETDENEEGGFSYVFRGPDETKIGESKRTFQSQILIKRMEPSKERVLVVKNGETTHDFQLEQANTQVPIIIESRSGTDSSSTLPQEKALVTRDLMVENLHLSLQDQGKRDYLWLVSPSFQHEIEIPKSGLDTKMASLYNRFFLGSMAIMALGLAVVAMFAHRFSAPLQRLALTAQEVGTGRLGAVVSDPDQSGEVGIAIREFNNMSIHLAELDAETQRMRRREYLSELGEIADGLAHTIRNPLNTIGLSIDQLSHLASDQMRAGELAQVARQQIRRIDQWIRSFLALASQGSAGTSEINLTAMLHDIVLEAIQSGPVEVDLEMPEALPTLQGVPGELRAVVQALVVNAVEASPEGGRVGVEVGREDDRALRIEITDEGPGLAPEVREKLFTPHVTTKVSGSGMGLFLARRIVTTRYEGSLEILDREPHGAIARLILPLETVND